MFALYDNDAIYMVLEGVHDALAMASYITSNKVLVAPISEALLSLVSESENAYEGEFYLYQGTLVTSEEMPA